MKYTRADLLDHLARTLITVPSHQPLLVAIDGRSAAGKTTLADDLATRIERQGRPTFRSSLDDFHPPGHKYRSAERRYTPQTYLDEGYDYAAFRGVLLDPLRGSGERRCRLALWDSYHDQPTPEQWTAIPDEAIVIIDGVFLLRPGLVSYWDYVIWVHIRWDDMVDRAANRDLAWVGSADVVRERYRTFWIPTHTLYETTHDPVAHAHTVIDNTNPAEPIIVGM
jgi:uridine kinase